MNMREVLIGAGVLGLAAFAAGARAADTPWVSAALFLGGIGSFVLCLVLWRERANRTITSQVYHLTRERNWYQSEFQRLSNKLTGITSYSRPTPRQTSAQENTARGQAGSPKGTHRASAVIHQFGDCSMFSAQGVCFECGEKVMPLNQ